jgi:high-affinity iron transporter
MLGIQEHPVLVEVIGWFAYLVPVGLFVAWPANRRVARRTLPLITAALAGAGVAALVPLLALSPAVPASNPATAAGALSARLASAPGQTAVVRTVPQSPAADGQAAAAAGTASAPITLHRTGSGQHDGVATDVYTASRPGTAAADRSARLSFTQVAALNGGRLPLGVRTTDANATVTVRYSDISTLTAWIEPRTGRVVDLRWTETVLATLTDTQVGTVPLDRPVTSAASGLPAATARSAASAAREDLSALDRRAALHAGAEAAGVVAVLALPATFLLAVTSRRRRIEATEATVTHVTTAAVPATPEGG